MPRSFLILFWVYPLIGPLAWLGMVALMLLGRERMIRMKRKREELPSSPSVSILIPAKDEGAGIRECVERALASDYPNFNVIAIDDRSADDTGRVLDDLAAANPGRLRVIHIADGSLPNGWLGKCNALHVGTRNCNCEWLLFVDSDVKIEPVALRDGLATCLVREYDALTIGTTIECHTFLERLMLPLAAGAWAMIFTVSLTNDDDRKEIAAANGQFFLIRREAYERVGGHAAVRDKITEDVELMRLLKSNDFCTRFFMAPHLASTRMHATFDQMLHGWSRIYAGTARRKPIRMIAAIFFIVACCYSLFPAIAIGAIDAVLHRDFRWLGAAAIHLLAMGGVLIFIYRSSGNRARYALGFPISAAVLILFLGRAIRLCRTGQVLWRGTIFSPTEEPSPPPFQLP